MDDSPPVEGSGPQAVPRNVKVLSWVSFFQDSASEMLYPVLPIFVARVLGAPPGVVGLIEGVAEATAAVSKAVAGRLADLRRRRPFIVAGYSTSAIAKPLIALASAWPLVLVARFLDRVGKGVRGAPRDAMIADESPPAVRGRAFGLHRAADTAGAVVGPLLGLGLYHLLDEQIRPLFLLAFVPAAVSVGLIFLVHERPRPVPPAADPVTDPDGGGPAGADPPAAPVWRGLGRPYWRLVSFLAAFAVVNFSDALLLLRANELGLGVGPTFVVYVAYNAVYATMAFPAGVLSDRVPRNFVFGAGLAVFAAVYLGLGLAEDVAWVWILLPVYGLYTGLTDGVARAWVADRVPPGRSGSGMGLYQMLNGFGALIAGIWAAVLWRGDGRVPLLLAGSVAAVLALVCVTIGGRRVSPGARAVPG